MSIPSNCARHATLVFVMIALVLTAFVASCADEPKPQAPNVAAPTNASPPAAGSKVEELPVASGSRTQAGPELAQPLPRTPATAALDPNAPGWQARGTVRSAAELQPIAAAHIDLSLRRDDGTELQLARTETGADGAFAVALAAVDELPWPASGSPTHAERVIARISADGFQPLVVTVPLAGGSEPQAPTARDADSQTSATRDAQGIAPTNAGQRVMFDARLVDGAALRGRAVDGEGRPVPHATAALSILDERSGPGGLRLLVEGVADEEGRFALGFGPSAKLILSVRADGVGTNSIEVEVEARRDRDLGDVVLGGGEPLSGIARHIDGTPARRLELIAVEGELAFREDGLETAVRRAREVERGGGLSWSRTITDAGGYFSFRGLKPQHYALKTADSRITMEPRQARWEPGQSNVELTIETPMLHVRVTDAAGNPVPGALVECTDLSTEEDGSFTSGDTRRGVTRGATADVAFSADPETPLALRARSGSRMSPESIVYFGQGTQHVETTLVLAAGVRTGTLRFLVEGIDAARVRVRAALASAATGTRDEGVGVLEADADGVVRDVPVGKFRLVLDFAGEDGAWCFPWKSKSAIEIAAEGETNVVVDPERGARLAIECALSGAPPSGWIDGNENKRAAFGARIVLAPADTAPGGPGERTLDLRLGDEDVYQLLPDETAEVRDLLPAGDWVLRVEGARWISTATPIRLIAGRRLSAVVELRAR